jgi:hypothetical protein
MARTNAPAVVAHARNMRRWGKDEKRRVCSDCRHFQRHEQSTSWFKCGLVGGGPAYDWRARWSACGAIDKATKELLRG